jgi:lysophospholipase L1-like esterase
MKTPLKLSLLTLLTMATIFTACDSNSYGPTCPYITYVGRVDKSNPNFVSFAYPGVSIHAEFRGTSITARFKDFAQQGMHNTFYCIIDQGEPQKIVLSESQYEYILASRLKDTLHKVELIKLTESLVGEVGFCGFYVGDKLDDAFLVCNDPLPTLKMEFVGNSITCGYGNELSSMTPKQGFSPLNENNYYAFGAITARELNAQYVCTAYSGRGVCRNYEGDSENTIPQFYNRTIATKPGSKWDHNDYIPDILVLNIGTNDFGAETTTKIPVDSIQFIAEYTAFLQRMRGYYPNAEIICAVGPMTNDDSDLYPKQLTRYSQYVLSAIKNVGGESNHVYYFETEPQKGPYGEDYHPTIATHQRIANELVSFIIENKLVKVEN